MRRINLRKGKTLSERKMHDGKQSTRGRNYRWPGSCSGSGSPHPKNIRDDLESKDETAGERTAES